MATLTMKALEARIAELEAQITTMQVRLDDLMTARATPAPSPKPQAPALASKPEPVITYFVRNGVRYQKSRVGNRSIERPCPEHSYSGGSEAIATAHDEWLATQ